MSTHKPILSTESASKMLVVATSSEFMKLHHVIDEIMVIKDSCFGLQTCRSLLMV